METHRKIWKVLEEHGSSLHNPVGTMEHHGNSWKPIEPSRIFHEILM